MRSVGDYCGIGIFADGTLAGSQCHGLAQDDSLKK
jgi:hypothetical protein